ncbi:hypothetical protein TNCV_1801281 [Trichonephila clavipes]|nr:hypothetical protein TNCV_1801281 [Trichonephila clavipes]
MVWGSMDSHGVGRLHIVSGTVKAMDYIEILQNKLLPTARDLLGNQSLIFQDDNAPLPSCKVETKCANCHAVGLRVGSESSHVVQDDRSGKTLRKLVSFEIITVQVSQSVHLIQSIIAARSSAG